MSQTKAKPDPGKVKETPQAPQPFLTSSRTAVVLACLFAIGLLLRVQHLDDVARRSPDELTYTMYASQIVEHGLGLVPALVMGYNTDTRLHLYPPPTRVGHLVLVAGMMKLTGVVDERAGVWLSCVASVLSLALLGWIGYRFLPPLAAIYALFYLAFSIPDLVDGRRCWQDSIVGFVGLLMIWCACEIGADSSKWWSYVVLVGAGSVSVTMKELMAFVYLGCVLYVMLLLIRQRAWKTIGALVIGGLVGAGLSLLCLAKAAGGLEPLFAVWQHLNAIAKDNPYMNYQNGPWYRWIWGFWILSPVNTVLAFIGAGLSVIPRSVLDRLELPFRPIDLSRLRLFSALTVILAVLMKILPNTQNFRYLAPVYAAMYCLGGLGLWAVWQWAETRLSLTTRQALGALGVIVIVGTAITGYMHFERKFVIGQVPDLSIKMVVDSRR